MKRRDFLRMAGLGTVAFSGDLGRAAGKTTQRNADGFFTLAKHNGRWLFIMPDGKPFFSVGLNHIDAATLRYSENVNLWREKYGNSMQRWLQEAVAPDLKAWGFNSVGWVQEVVTRGQTNHRHSRNFTFEEYQWLDMPYCHMLPFADFHQWEAETRHPDLFSKDFEDWCDYVARAHCARLADDPKLIGYFYIDCPTWVHVREMNKWKGPLFDPEKLETEAGSKELFELADRYYKVTHDAIRRYDLNHLILGDRYEGKAPLPEEVVKAAAPYVDVLSFQHFGQPEQIRAGFERWHKLTGKPVLLADANGRIRLPGGASSQPEWYRRTMKMLRDMPAAVGFHLCGAYLRNRTRRAGIRSELEKPNRVLVEGLSKANRETAEWILRLDKSAGNGK